jgi:hypothetical protein
MPGRYQKLLIVLYNSLNRSQLMRAKAEIPRQADRTQPELGAPIVTIHVNVCGFVGLVAVEVESVRANPQYRRHDVMLPHRAAGATIFWTERSGEARRPLTPAPSLVCVLQTDPRVSVASTGWFDIPLRVR